MVDEPTRVRTKPRQLLPERVAQTHCRKDRQQPHHRPRPYRERRAVGLAQPIIEEAILLIPELDHRNRDQGEVLEEFYSDILIAAIVVGEPQRDLKHVETVLRHPGRAIELSKT